MTEFALDISKWVEKVKGNLDQAFRALAIEVAKRIIQRTPVKSGAARGGWMAGVNSRPTGETPLDPDGAATLARIAAVINTAKVGDVIYLTNSVSHAYALEFGRSEMAPAGMVRVTLVEAQAIANQVAARLPK